MPDHGSWFDVLFGTLLFNLQNALATLNFTEDGTSWIAHSPPGVQHVLGYGFVVLLLILVGLRVSGQVRNVGKALVPEDQLTIRTFVELIVGAVYNMMVDMMGKKAAKFFLPLIAACAFVIFFSNVLGLIPGFLPPTDNLNTTLAMAAVIFFVTHVFGVKEHGIAYFKHFFGPLWWLAPLMFVIEIISHLVRPASLAIRLMANMTADHKVLAIFTGLVPFVVPIPMLVMGCIVVSVQTLVFCLLSAIYIQLAIAHEEH